MTKRMLVSLLLTLILPLALASQAGAQEKAKKSSPKVERLSGRVQVLDKSTSTVEVRTSSNVPRTVVYSASTTFTYRNKPGSLDDLKEGRRVICLGTFEGVKLIATRIDIRDK